MPSRAPSRPFNLLRFNLFACLWCDSPPLLTLFHPYIRVHTSIAPCPGQFRLSIPQAKNLF